MNVSMTAMGNSTTLAVARGWAEGGGLLSVLDSLVMICLQCISPPVGGGDCCLAGHPVTERLFVGVAPRVLVPQYRKLSGWMGGPPGVGFPGLLNRSKSHGPHGHHMD